MNLWPCLVSAASRYRPDSLLAAQAGSGQCVTASTTSSERPRGAAGYLDQLHRQHGRGRFAAGLALTWATIKRRMIEDALLAAELSISA